MPPADGAQTGDHVPWQGVLEALDEVVLLLNAHDVVTWAAPSVARRLGWAPDDVAGRALGELVHPDDLRAALRNLAEVAAAGVVRQAMRVRRSDGSYTCMEWSFTRADSGATVLTGRDGTARLTLEERLAAADRRYRALFGALAEAVVFLDARLRVEEVNDEAATLLGRTRTELLGRAWYDVLDVWDEDGRRLTLDSPFVRRLVTEPSRHEVWRSVLRPDGQRVLLRGRWTPLGGGPAAGRGYVLTMRGAMTSSVAGAALPLQRRHARAAAGLTPREHEVLERLADGQDATEIARELELSVYSVRGHIKSVIRKLGVHSQLQAVVIAARRGIVDVVGEARSAPVLPAPSPPSP